MKLRRLSGPLLLRMTILVVIGSALFVFKGLASTLEPWSQAMVNAVAKYAYPKDGQQDATVLLFREENIAELGTHYPIPYAVHADVMEALATYAPRAVFIDFAFINQRPNENIEVLAKALCTLAESSRIYIAAPVSETGEISIRRELLRCAQPVIPDIKDPSGDSGILTYTHGTSSEDGFVPAAAFALAGRTDASSDMEIIWGKDSAPLNRKWMNCSDKSAWQQIKALAGNPLANQLGCPFHRTISVNHLLNSTGDSDVEAALSERTVFYGGNFQFVGDRIASPVYGELPGIYLHAMAYDNLLAFKEDFKRADRDRWYVKAIDFVQLILAAYLLLAFPATPTKTVDTSYQFLNNFGRGLAVIFAVSTLLLTAANIGQMDAFCLVAAGCYALYRISVKKDWHFFSLLLLTASFAAFSFTVLDLGPRNLLAFLGFFELARWIKEKLATAKLEYEKLKQKAATEGFRYPDTRFGGIQKTLHQTVFTPFLEWLFSIFEEPTQSTEKADQ